MTPSPLLSYSPPLLAEIWALHASFRARRPALVAHDGRRSWGELIERTSQLANGLRALGLAPGDRIGILMSNGVRTVETIMGALRGGFVAVPLNLSVTDAAIEGMLTDSGARAVFVTADQAHRIARADDFIVLVSAGGRREQAALGFTDYDTWIEGQPTDSPQVEIRQDWLANIIYSSGTTGVPKGIAHDHAGRLGWTNDLALALRYHPQARTLVTTGLYSNISWLGMLCTFLVGGTLFVHENFDPGAFLETVERERISHVAMVPVQFQRVIEHPEFERFDRSSLQAMVSAGSKLHPRLKQRLLDAFACGVAEDYGMTEGLTTILDPEEARDRLDSAGLPVFGTEMAILGTDDERLPRGAIGEIIGRSRFSMVGYWNRPEATRDATWVDERGRAWLRTGDIGKIDDGGYLYVLDRKKDMILTGGQNVYPADIEGVLLGHPEVAECAVIGIPSEQWGETPLALVVPRQHCPDAAVLREWVNARVGRRQRVHAVEFREILPRNPNGKLLKRELRAQFWT